MLFTILISSAFSFAIGFSISIVISKRRMYLLSLQLKKKEEENKKQWIELLKNIHQTDQLEKESSPMMNIILWAISNCIPSYTRLYERQDWNTKEVVTELRMIAIHELMSLHKKINNHVNQIDKSKK